MKQRGARSRSGFVVPASAGVGQVGNLSHYLAGIGCAVNLSRLSARRRQVANLSYSWPPKGGTTYNSAFTLIELLIVIAIIAILALIAIPNFLEAQVRSKVSRARIDMASLAAALRSYCADHNAYPPNSPSRREFLAVCAQGNDLSASSLFTPPDAEEIWAAEHSRQTVFPILDSSGYDLARLTTPVAYVSRSLPMELFNWRYSPGPNRQSGLLPYRYVNVVDVHPEPSPVDGVYRRYILSSPGPDLGFSEPNPVLGPFLPYDPTNGTISDGDLLEFGL